MYIIRSSLILALLTARGTSWAVEDVSALRYCPALSSYDFIHNLLQEFDVTYIAPRALAATGVGSTSRTRPLTDEFLTYSRWAKLTTLTLTNLRGGSHAPTADFLAAHPHARGPAH